MYSNTSIVIYSIYDVQHMYILKQKKIIAKLNYINVLIKTSI